jgi:hypothetical protein
MFSLMEILMVTKMIFACAVADENDGVDCVQALGTYLQSCSNVVSKQQQEINELQTLCQTLKRVSKLHIFYETVKAANTIHDFVGM